MATWTEAFPYADGALTLNAGWAQLGNYNSPVMAAGNVQISYTGSYSGALNATDVPGFLVGSPWTLTAIVKAQGASDLGGFLALFIGDDYSTPELTATLRFAPDGLSNNELSNVQIIDATGFIETGAPVAFASGTDHTIVLAYDGTDLTLTIDNVLILTKANADITAVPAQVGLNGRTEDPADLWIISQMSLVYTSSGETITIHVTNGTGDIEGASVTLGTDTQTTDASGIATFAAVADGSHDLAISADDYWYDSTSITTDASHTAFTETLVRTEAKVILIADELTDLLNDAAGSTGYTDAGGKFHNYIFGAWTGAPAVSPVGDIKRVYDVVSLLETIPTKPVVYVQPIFPKAREESMLARNASNVTHKVGVSILRRLTAAPADITAFNAELDAFSGITERAAAILKAMTGRQLPTTRAVLRQVEWPWLLHRDTLQTKQLFESEVVLTFFSPEVDQ